MTATIIQPGIHDLGFVDYLALPAWGSSALRAMRRGPPARVLWERANSKPDTDATRLGSAAHCAFLTPSLFERGYAHKPDGMSFATREGKAWRDEQGAKTILTHEAGVLVGGVVRALDQKATVFDARVNASHVEASLVWECPRSGELCKAKPDWIEGRYIYDLKVSRHAEGRALAYRAFVEGWLHQLAHYRTGAQALGLDVDGGRLVVVAPRPPHYVYTLECKVDALDLLELENIETLKRLRECRESGVFEGTPDEWVKVEPPAAALAEFGEITLETEDE